MDGAGLALDLAALRAWLDDLVVVTLPHRRVGGVSRHEPKLFALRSPAEQQAEAGRRARMTAEFQPILNHTLHLNSLFALVRRCEMPIEVWTDVFCGTQHARIEYCWNSQMGAQIVVRGRAPTNLIGPENSLYAWRRYWREIVFSPHGLCEYVREVRAMMRFMPLFEASEFINVAWLANYYYGMLMQEYGFRTAKVASILLLRKMSVAYPALASLVEMLILRQLLVVRFPTVSRAREKIDLDVMQAIADVFDEARGSQSIFHAVCRAIVGLAEMPDAAKRLFSPRSVERITATEQQ